MLARFLSKPRYQQRKSFAERYAESKKIRTKYPDYIPVIVETTLPLDKHRYLVHADLTLMEFMLTVRKRLTIPASASVFFLVDNTLAPTGSRMRELYVRHQHPDGFLYLNLVAENTFGGV